MNPAAILALISDLYGQIIRLQQENAELRQRLEPPASPNGEPEKSAVVPVKNRA